jgi:activating signal cointegrator 1
MKALSIKPQWAALIASGAKTIETRKRPTSHRGPLLICATRPDGMARCIVDIIDCRPMRPDDWKAACCDPYADAWGWIIGSVTPIEPFAVRGMPGLFDIALPSASSSVHQAGQTPLLPWR